MTRISTSSENDALLVVSKVLKIGISDVTDPSTAERVASHSYQPLQPLQLLLAYILPNFQLLIGAISWEPTVVVFINIY